MGLFRQRQGSVQSSAPEQPRSRGAAQPSSSSSSSQKPVPSCCPVPQMRLSRVPPDAKLVPKTTVSTSSSSEVTRQSIRSTKTSSNKKQPQPNCRSNPPLALGKSARVIPVAILADEDLSATSSGPQKPTASCCPKNAPLLLADLKDVSEHLANKKRPPLPACSSTPLMSVDAYNSSTFSLASSSGSEDSVSDEFYV